MLELDKLKQEREQAYDVWFERWWKKEDIEGQIKARNAKGYTNLWISFFNGLDDYTRNRLLDIRFEDKVKAKLPGFVVQNNKQELPFTGRAYIKGLVIRWK